MGVKKVFLDASSSGVAFPFQSENEGNTFVTEKP
jgi:hypothetical protein